MALQPPRRAARCSSRKRHRAAGQLGGGHETHPGRGQLDRQGDPVEAPADLGDAAGRLAVGTKAGAGRGPIAEQLAHPPSPQRHRPARTRSPPTPSGSRLVASTPTVGHDAEPAEQLGRRVQQMLAVVQDHQQPPAPQVVDHAVDQRPALLQAQRRCDRVRHRPSVRHRRQLAQPHPVGELSATRPRRLQRQAGLAHAAHPRQRDHRPRGTAAARRSNSSPWPTKLVAADGKFPAGRGSGLGPARGREWPAPATASLGDAVAQRRPARPGAAASPVRICWCTRRSAAPGSVPSSSSRRSRTAR